MQAMTAYLRAKLASCKERLNKFTDTLNSYDDWLYDESKKKASLTNKAGWIVSKEDTIKAESLTSNIKDSSFGDNNSVLATKLLSKFDSQKHKESMKHHTGNVMFKKHHTGEVMFKKHHTGDVMFKKHHTGDVMFKEHNNNIIGMNQEVRAGNRCNHDKNSFKQYIPPSVHKKKPYAIINMVAKIIDIFSKPVENLLVLLNTTKSSMMRSERREACGLVLSALADTYNAENRIIGFIDHSGQRICLTLDQIAQRTGLGEKRVDRAVADLKELGLLKIEERRVTTKKGDIVSISALKSFTPLFFSLLGRNILDGLVKLKERAFKQYKSFTKKSKKQVAFSVNKIVGEVMQIKDKIMNTSSQPVQKAPEEAKREIDQAYRMHQDDPSKSLSAYLLQIRSAKAIA